ncbi:MAG TPA: ribbon-helix-helix domain-containing protein [Humisphaera sp.]|jgi:hypothetical protein|nr:ribbon-helix-helix domain-containing protein [Humisphaera sp.]
MKKNLAKPWTQMTADELAAATSEFDDPNYRPPAIKAPPALAARHRKALAALRAAAERRSKRRKIQVSVEDELLKKADEMAHRHGRSRSDLITAGLHLLLD